MARGFLDAIIRRSPVDRSPLGAQGMLAAALDRLRSCLGAERRYRPERRYMRGGRPPAAGPRP
jgi:hypothetical protein